MECFCCRGWVRTSAFEGFIKPIFPLSKPTELHGIPYILQASPKPSELFCPNGHPFLSSAIFVIVRSLYPAITLAHSASISSHFPRTYTTTYLSCMLRFRRNHRPSRELHRFGIYLFSSGCTYGLITVSFHSIVFEVYFDAVSTQDFARALPFRTVHVTVPRCLGSIHLVSDSSMLSPTCRDCHYTSLGVLRKV